MKRYIKLSLGLVAGLLIALVLFVLNQNSYKMIEKKIEFETPQGLLTGTLALPKNYSANIGLVVFIHGDGPTNDTYDGGYKPLWEKFASVGYASLSLNKPGIHGSSGNWLEQSMEDRAQEAIHAIDWAKSLPMIDDKRIGLWGASQAGWVIPKIVREEHNISFSILVSPAINWIAQGKYNTKAQMEQDGYSAQEIMEKETYNEQVLHLIQEQASYSTYLKFAQQNDLISKERWEFIAKNVQSDATEELAYFASPVHLVLGGQDINVDVLDTERVYRHKISSSLLSVSNLPNADHSMLKKALAKSELRTYLTAIFFPRKLFDDQYLNDLTQFVSQVQPTK
ncbi:alpha/beta hydrolase family protein [Paenibacillus monticola]|uniref:Alpha/beta hydrolase n=1 Tax=Paenibacillus monticola TaxID=2666075 RepID=A0A7X2L0P9_9BACL|nr:CocE/NonD family hydrolase [Paenibacillus monticola]MRN52942.1 alpha/beta hydrolase [Paenibacillus monticola]